LLRCEIGKTRSGKPKAFPEKTPATDHCLCVFRTKIGFRGGNSHTGDRTNFDSDEFEFLPFPGEILGEGTIAQGLAGRAGSGRQVIAVMPKNIVFRTGYSGRLYGGPAAHYYLFDGQKIHALTWPEREAADLWF